MFFNADDIAERTMENLIEEEQNKYKSLNSLWMWLIEGQSTNFRKSQLTFFLFQTGLMNTSDTINLQNKTKSFLEFSNKINPHPVNSEWKQHKPHV